MSLLWIIGNGFDLQHGLPTSYRDFWKWLHRVCGLTDFQGENHGCNFDVRDLSPITMPDGEEVFSRKDQAEFLCWVFSACSPNADGWSNLEEAIGLLDFEELLADIYYEDKDGDPNYWQITSEITDRSDWIEIGLLKTLKFFKEWVDNELSRLHASPQRTFEELFSIQPRRFATFNYTETLEITYGIDHAEVIHLHGKSNATWEEFRFGHGQPNTPIQDVAFGSADELVTEFLKASRKQLNLDILDQLDYAKVSGIVFYGFSFGTVDQPYIARLRERCPASIPWFLVKRNREDCSVIENALPSLKKFQPASVHALPLDEINLRHLLARNSRTA